MIDDMMEIAKKNVAEFDFEKAIEYVYDLTRNRRLTFMQFRELMAIIQKING